ncbi:two component transcriptional regulator, LuxR family [Beutenbergia cavernae DSM 12333]|uniref:Two component transcriptional regulator, LuxR family n=1 Tax=Beutenbergia cavernae (strain ATCC BAA-8 / DSM 12333 / CCUG 43141 / JCM 11478 / NBRC 16432 / NCIMB 13614 / HKI 0122) TaxID=471853 RepID=C5BV53_BEUC1|nr:response regulator transcription factor [Beutenbergia cavernae]ACQ80440.1 two component transcriptional regulator, LuxR family [Beutenbergia cavernae DSM 12333]
MTTVLVVDDHPVYRRGIAHLLAAGGYDVVGEAAGVREAEQLALRLRPSVVIMDLGLPDGSGVDATSRIVAANPGTRVVVVTLFDDDGSVQRALAAGAAGYVVKDADPDEILAAVRAVETGAMVLGAHLAGAVLGAAAVAARPAEDVWGLTPRERQVLDLLVKGLTNRAIAERLGLSGKTVANNVSVILGKLGATDRVEATQLVRAQRAHDPSSPSHGSLA